MFWYIGGVLAGFAIGYVVATAQTRKRGRYKKGINDCRNCKNVEFVHSFGIVECKVRRSCLDTIPNMCAKYQRMETKK